MMIISRGSIGFKNLLSELTRGWRVLEKYMIKFRMETVLVKA